ncbi:MAG: Lrp/AsnC family transcriptional regulator [Alphaproteobacteria bacterium]|nr:MAG: Lrp/AsnC family transcriptional regulator [Alphaproteobacteria bacterium]
MEESLDPASRRLLSLLQEDATRPLRELGERAGMSQSAVWRRVQELEAAGLITARVALIDPWRAGFAVAVIVQVNLRGHAPETRAAFEAFVRGAGEIQQCHAVTGPHDYTLLVRARSVADYERFLMQRLLAHPSVASAQSNIALREIKNSTRLPL